MHFSYAQENQEKEYDNNSKWIDYKGENLDDTRKKRKTTDKSFSEFKNKKESAQHSLKKENYDKSDLRAKVQKRRVENSTNKKAKRKQKSKYLI